MNFVYLKQLNKKTYTTSKKSIVISGPEGTGKTSYLKWHSFRCQHERAKENGITLKEQIKKEGYVSFYVNLDEITKNVEMLPLQERAIVKRKYQIDYTEEKEAFINMHFFRDCLLREWNEFVNIVERENGIEEGLKKKCEQEMCPIEEKEYTFEDALTGDLMRTFMTQFMPERMLNLLTNLGRLVMEMLELTDEKIIFAIDCGPYLNSDPWEQKMIGYYIRHCSKSDCKNITIRCASTYGCEDMEMLYPYLSCKSAYKEVCLIENMEETKTRDAFVEHMKKVVTGYFHDSVEFPVAFLYYTYPNIALLLSMSGEWKNTGMPESELNIFLQEKAKKYISCITDEEELHFVETVGTQLKEQWENNNRIYYFRHSPKKWSWKKKFRELQNEGIINKVSREIYALHPLLYPLFGIYLEEYMDSTDRNAVEITENLPR